MHQTIILATGAMAESIELGPHVQKIKSLDPSRVKLMTYKIDTWLFLA